MAKLYFIFSNVRDLSKINQAGVKLIGWKDIASKVFFSLPCSLSSMDFWIKIDENKCENLLSSSVRIKSENIIRFWGLGNDSPLTGQT